MRRLRWILLAAIPCSLMLGATTYMTTDIAAIPFLWVLPLAIYLLSFILVFAKIPPLVQSILVFIAVEGAALFRDMETGEELEVDPAGLRAAYQEQMRELCAFYKKGLAEMGIDYQLINTKQSYDLALSAYLNRRARTRR